MPQYCPAKSERNGDHHRHRPSIGAEHPRQNNVDQRQSEQRACLHVAAGLPLVFSCALEMGDDTVLTLQVGDNGLLDIGKHLVGVGDVGIDIGCDMYPELAVTVA